MIKTIIVDDHQMFIDGITQLLSSFENVEVVGHANNGVELFNRLKELEVDLILLDISMPEMDGIEAAKQISKEYPSVKMITLTMHNTPDFIQKVLKAGVHGYVLKNTGQKELRAAIDTVFNGQSFYSAEVSEKIMNSLMKREAIENDYRYVELTEREKEVLILISKEFTTKEIAEQLFVSPHTIETHRKNLISKLQVRNVTGLVKYAVQMGYLD